MLRVLRGRHRGHVLRVISETSNFCAGERLLGVCAWLAASEGAPDWRLPMVRLAGGFRVCCEAASEMPRERGLQTA
jgi:hypothetical protein